MEWFFVAGIILFAAIFIGGSIWYEKQRAKKIRAVAESLGLAYAEKGDGLREKLSMLPLFRRGRSRRIRNLLTGQIEDMAIHLFDYRFRTGSGKNSQTHNQTVAAFRVEGGRMPAFTLAPEHWGHRFLSVFGFQDIDFTNYPEFSRIYILRGEEEERIRALFDEELIRFMLSHTGNTVEGASEWIVVYRSRKRTKPDDLAGFMERGFIIASSVSLAAMRGGLKSWHSDAATPQLGIEPQNPGFVD